LKKKKHPGEDEYEANTANSNIDMAYCLVNYSKRRIKFEIYIYSDEPLFSLLTNLDPSPRQIYPQDNHNKFGERISEYLDNNQTWIDCKKEFEKKISSKVSVPINYLMNVGRATSVPIRINTDKNTSLEIERH
jgi:hypothetical protein